MHFVVSCLFYRLSSQVRKQEEQTHFLIDSYCTGINLMRLQLNKVFA